MELALRGLQPAKRSSSRNYLDDHLQLEVTGRLANTIWYDEISGGRGYAHWAISGSHADSTDNGNNSNEARFRTRPEARSEKRWLNTGRISNADYFNLLGLEGVINVGRIQVVGEYQRGWIAKKSLLMLPLMGVTFTSPTSSLASTHALGSKIRNPCSYQTVPELLVGRSLQWGSLGWMGCMAIGCTLVAR